MPNYRGENAKNAPPINYKETMDEKKALECKHNNGYTGVHIGGRS